MAEAMTATLDIHARDVTGQKRFSISDIPVEQTVGEFVKSLIGRLTLVDRDHEGRPLEYRARLEREGRQLHGSELLRDALENDDEIVLTPWISAG